VAQLEATVDAASDAAADVEKADRIRAWLNRDELQDETFDVLDSVGKGYSFTRIQWDTSEGQWQPKRLDRWDQRWFRFARHDLTTPLMLDEGGRELPLPPGEFIFAVMKAKSGLPMRSGLARVAAWAWMFKAFANRDWAIFTQTYGQPIRIGKYGADATDDDKRKLYRAVANIAGDCAAIMPDGMAIEFVEAKSIGASIDLYEKRVDWLDRQVSKAVLGQTTTTDAITGGHAVSEEHRKVQEDIERADARALAAILNRDLVRLWIDLEYGPQKAYPRLTIARPEKEDLAQLSTALSQLVPIGLRVQASEIRDKFGLAEPGPQDEVLALAAPKEPGNAERSDKTREKPALQHQHAPAAALPDELIGQQGADLGAPAIAALVDRVRGLVGRAGSLEAAEAALARVAAAERAPVELVNALRQAMLLAWLAGEAEEADRGD
jgi:phage gp29-like protein